MRKPRQELILLSGLIFVSQVYRLKLEACRDLVSLGVSRPALCAAASALALPSVQEWCCNVVRRLCPVRLLREGLLGWSRNSESQFIYFRRTPLGDR